MAYADPAYNREYQRKWRERNPDYNKEYYRKRIAENPRYNKETKIRSNYKLSLEQWDAMYGSQNGRCAICGDEAKLHVDHNHSTGEVRGLLCSRCNLGIGCFVDDPERMRSAISYVHKWKKGK